MSVFKDVFWEMITPVDTTMSGQLTEHAHPGRGLSTFKLIGLCKCLFWWAVALVLGLLIAKLH